MFFFRFIFLFFMFFFLLFDRFFFFFSPYLSTVCRIFFLTFDAKAVAFISHKLGRNCMQIFFPFPICSTTFILWFNKWNWKRNDLLMPIIELCERKTTFLFLHPFQFRCSDFEPCLWNGQTKLAKNNNIYDTIEIKKKKEKNTRPEKTIFFPAIFLIKTWKKYSIIYNWSSSKTSEGNNHNFSARFLLQETNNNNTIEITSPE